PSNVHQAWSRSMNALTQIAPATAAPTPGAMTHKPTALSAFGSVRKMPAFSIEWAAGILDGKGCIHIARQTYRSKRRDTFRLRVYIVQNNREVLEHFRDGVGIDARLY